MTHPKDARRALIRRRMRATTAGLAGLALVALAPAGFAQSNETTPEPGQNADNQPGQPLNTPAQAEGPIAEAVAARVKQLAANNDRMKSLKTFYQNNGYTLAWFNDDGSAKDVTRRFVNAIEQVSAQGLKPANYRDQTLNQVLSGNQRVGTPDQAAQLDIDVSERFLALAHDLHFGVIDDPSIHVQWQKPRNPVDYQKALEKATSGDPGAVLSSLAPQQPEYQALKKALARYRKLADQGGWPTISEGSVLHEGDSDPRIATLWTRLQATGDAPTDTPAPQKYDQSIMQAIEHFQTRNGLKVDGLLGPSTRDALNITAAQRVDDIQLNMERWRWMPRSFGPRYIAVNVPAFELDAHDTDRSDLSMNVIVGGSYNDRETPIFGDTMQYLVFRPYWNVPPSIAADEIVPEQRKNPNYLASKNYQIVAHFGPDAQPMAVTPANINKVASGDLLIRQAGGPDNALGLVKFIFPNDHAVYLHSTSAKQLFDKSDRDLSHGCVRVEDPVALAAFALDGDPKWNKSKIDRAMHSGGRKRIELPESIPVYLLYWTAFVEDNTVNFRQDLYEHDQELSNALNSKSAIQL